MKKPLAHQIRLLAIASLLVAALGFGIPQSARAQFVWISASPSSLNFGNQQVGTTSAAQTVTVTNNNEVEITLGGLTASGEFGLSNDACSWQTLAAFATCTFDVTFHPLSAGAKTGTVDIPTEFDGVSASVPLSGNGVVPAVSLSTTSLNFGNQLVGTSSAAQTVTVTNTGGANLTLGNLVVTTHWILSNDTCSLANIAPSGTCTFDVSFQPLSTGAKTGTVTFASNAASSPDDVSLSGTGIPTQTLRFRSYGTNDGTVRESSETSGIGQLIEPVTELISVGDDYAKRQLVGIVDFDTSSLPDNAVLTSARLQVKVMVITNGVYAALGDMLAQVTKPHFGNSASLHKTDFQAPFLANAGVFTRTNTYNRWITLNMVPNSLFAINTIGRTQFRLHFTLDDNNDGIKQEIRFLSGDYGVVRDQPTLIVTYYVP